MPVIPPAPWAELEPSMQTGDLILFSGSKPESRWIELMTGGMFSHATMIYRPDPSAAPWMWQEAPAPIVGDPYVKSPDPLKVLHGGAQLGDALAATQVIRYEYGDIPYYVQLDGDLSATLNGPMAAVVAEYEDRPFGTVLEMALDYFIGHEFNISSGEATLYCAALLGLTFMKTGLFNATHPANWFSPNSFVAPGSADLPWTLAGSFKLPVEIEVPPLSPTASAPAHDVSLWPAGPLAPAQLSTPPMAPRMTA